MNLSETFDERSLSTSRILSNESSQPISSKGNRKGKGKGKYRGKGTRQRHWRRHWQGQETGQATWENEELVRESAWAARALDRSGCSVVDHTIPLSVPNITISQRPSSTDKVIARSPTRICLVKTTRRLTHLFTAVLPFLLFSVSVLLSFEEK